MQEQSTRAQTILALPIQESPTRAHQMLGDTGAALRACAEGLSFHPEDAELWFRQAVVHRLTAT